MTTATPDCPRCALPLSHLRIGGVDTDVCEHCGGVWLDRLELASLEDPGNAFGDALVAHLNQFPPALSDHSRRLRCPRHPSVVMLRRAYSPANPTHIDECPECGGVWLDTNELASMLGFAILFIHPPLVLFLLSLGYALSGPVLTLVRVQQRRARRRREPEVHP